MTSPSFRERCLSSLRDPVVRINAITLLAGKLIGLTFVLAAMWIYLAPAVYAADPPPPTPEQGRRLLLRLGDVLEAAPLTGRAERALLEPDVRLHLEAGPHVLRLPSGETWFVELKAPRGRLSPTPIRNCKRTPRRCLTVCSRIKLSTWTRCARS